MKKVLVLMIAVMFVIGVGIYTTADAGIQGSSHDFTDNLLGKKGNTGGTVATETGTDEWNSKRKEICRVCHIPHTHGRTNFLNALDMGIGATTPQSLLWNRALSAAPFTLYDGSAGTIADIPGTAKLRLSCHDGVTAVDDWPDAGLATGVAPSEILGTSGQYSGGYNIGTDMQGTHPIGVTYTAAAGEFFDDTNTWANGDTIADTLDGGTVVCATCHDVHSQEHVVGTHLLRQVTKATDQAGANASALCLTCHDK